MCLRTRDQYSHRNGCQSEGGAMLAVWAQRVVCATGLDESRWKMQRPRRQDTQHSRNGHLARVEHFTGAKDDKGIDY